MGWRAQLPPEMADAVEFGLQVLADMGIPAHITEAYRTYDRQAYLYAQGRTRPGAIVTKAPPGASAHNYGLAVDIMADRGYGTEDQKLVQAVGRWVGFTTYSWDLPHWEYPSWKSVVRVRVAQPRTSRG